ncbi:MAG: hypothetical protein LBP39_00535 [Rickettsiales bacterium]|jgi:hypothetical protein|nr:hypothetical protein [Rickettsiales bacterium]
MSDSEENDGYELYRRRFLEQYFFECHKGDVIADLGYLLLDQPGENKVIDNLDENLDIIWSIRLIRPRNDIGNDDIFFETDLHGDMAAFLNTLCETGAVKYKNGEEALIFYNPEKIGEEKDTYTLGELEILKETNVAKHRELMEKLQPLANVEPTKKYSHYINCGDFMDRGKQSEQMIHMINYLDWQCKKKGIKPAKLIMGNHELCYLDTFSTGYITNKGNCIYGDFDTIVKQSNLYLTCSNIYTGISNTALEIHSLYSNKIKSQLKAVKKAVENRALILAHSQGTTIFSHVVITKKMVKDFAETLSELAEERKTVVNDESTVNGIDRLAETFTQLNDKITKNEPFDEDDAQKLTDGLNEFLSVRSKIIKSDNISYCRSSDEFKAEYRGSDAEKKLLGLMNSLNYEGILLNRIKDVKENHLIPGLKYIVGHDADEEYSSMKPSDDHGKKVILADCFRSSGYIDDYDVTRANYAVVDPVFLLGEIFTNPPNVREKEMTKYYIAEGAEEAYGEYLRNPTIDQAISPAVDTRVATPLGEANNSTAIEKEVVEEKIEKEVEEETEETTEEESAKRIKKLHNKRLKSLKNTLKNMLKKKQESRRWPFDKFLASAKDMKKYSIAIRKIEKEIAGKGNAGGVEKFCKKYLTNIMKNKQRNRQRFLNKSRASAKNAEKFY